MNNELKNESGMTLVELIGAIVILFIISGLTFPIIMNGLKVADTIQNETMFRDEADYLMAAVLKDLYLTKETEIVKTYLPEHNTANYYILKKDNIKTGFINNELVVSNRVLNTKNNSIKILSSSTIELLGAGEYEIILKLQLLGEKSKIMEFHNIIRTINDKEAES